MLIRFTSAIAGTLNGRIVQPGEVFDLPEPAAEEFVARGLAEPLTGDMRDETVETATLPGPPETTAIRRRRPKGR